MTTWYKVKIGKFDLRYTPLNQDEKYPYCDIKGEELSRVNETMQQEERIIELEKKKDKTEDEEKELVLRKNLYNLKPFYVNSKTGEKHEKAFKLVDGKPLSEVKKTEETEKYLYCEEQEVNNLVIEKEYLVRSPDLYRELTEKKQALKVALSFGRGIKAYRCIITPSKFYNGFLDMRAGQKYKSEIVEAKVGELEELERLKDILKEVNMANSKITATADDLIKL